MNDKKFYKLTAPTGNIIIPNDRMSEQELRDFVPQLIQDPATAEIWKEKAAKDDIEELVAFLEQGGYAVKVVK